MNRLMKMAMIVAGVGAMLGFAGCGGSESEYEGYVREMASTMRFDEAKRNAFVNESVEKFRKMSPETQKVELEKIRKIVTQGK